MSGLAPLLIQRFLDANDLPLVGGQIFTYVAGTSTPLATFTDSTLTTPNANPTILDANGQAQVWIGTGNYKFVIEDVNGNVQFTVDNVNLPGTGPTGASFLTGTGTPSNGTGQNGDTYLDIATGNYWFKSGGTWAQTSTGWTKYSVTNGQSATNLTGQTVDNTVYSSARYNCEIIRGTTVVNNIYFCLQSVNGTWRILFGEDVGDLSGVTFSITQASTVAQLQVALDSGAGNGTIKVARVLVPV